MFPIFSRVFLFFFPQTSRFMVDVPILFSNQIPMFSHAFPHEKLFKPWEKIPHIEHSQWCGVSRLPISHILQRLPSARSHAALRPCGSVLDVSRDAEIRFTHHLWIIYIYCTWNYCMFFFELNHVEPSKFWSFESWEFKLQILFNLKESKRTATGK